MHSSYHTAELKRLSQACPAHASAVLPPEGLLVEANCIISVAQAERDIRAAEEKLARLHVKESILRARLYKVQAAMGARLVQISDAQVGKARAEREHLVEERTRPLMNEMRAAELGST